MYASIEQAGKFHDKYSVIKPPITSFCYILSLQLILYTHFLSCAIFLFPKSILREKMWLTVADQVGVDLYYILAGKGILTVINLFLAKRGRYYTPSTSFSPMILSRIFPFPLSLCLSCPLTGKGLNAGKCCLDSQIPFPVLQTQLLDQPGREGRKVKDVWPSPEDGLAHKMS